MNAPKKQIWALGGRLVTTVEEAKAVRAWAIKEGRLYLLPQCRSVIAQLAAAEQQEQTA